MNDTTYTDSQLASIIERVEKGSRRAPLTLERRCELTAALLWLIEMAAQAGAAEPS